ncbi:neuferricin homolog [Drosophila sulfurigaster albostrigata]|uniref:neuferricin homolog n=1 Tax=Drosophila sulfurigaster albostrigata TaxID=89887 RepID=UPI002D21B4CE|nr:neuferricin homolog [Drosophila sulfurigaster albostrigata]
MFGLSYRLALILIIVAVLAKVYQRQIVEIFEIAAARYLDYATTKDGESVAVEFTETRGSVLLLTPEELATYNGEQGRPIYLALLGAVFDVSRGIKHYGPGCSYNFFVGRDASVSFVTGEFENYDPETADDVLSLKGSSLLELAKWQQFYEKDYEYKGKLIGRFYDKNGKKTTYHQKYLALLDQAERAKAEIDELRNKYPGCNIEWSEAKGTRVWCTPTSGDGKPREWSGFPRKLYNRDNKNFHCACVPEAELDDPMFKSYDNCDPNADECFYRV